MSTKRESRATKSAETRTDWDPLQAMQDAAISFTADAPQTAAEDWADAVAHRGLPLPSRKEQIALRVDADVLQWFRAQGTGWQTRMNAVLRSYRDALGAQASASAKPGTRQGKAESR
ncbi:BrnA antitoxin family protein [Nevskia sp.]|uniref:BrnA antitoxin family protein n=1 Tax=Nevskia sp. TaxID=1929292 RepID=UPI0025FA6E88|nr:BrnA antitoxin family protein [Nevskia sp.]